MNTTLGAGDETKGRPLLGGVGQTAEGTASRQGASFGFSAPLEVFARVSSSIAAGTGGSFTTNPGDRNPRDGSGQEN